MRRYTRLQRPGGHSAGEQLRRRGGARPEAALEAEIMGPASCATLQMWLESWGTQREASGVR